MPAEFPGEFHPVDLADRAATGQALEKVLAGGTINAIVNNVALVRPARIGRSRRPGRGLRPGRPGRGSDHQAALPGMTARWGRIINITSMGTVGKPERTPTARPRRHWTSAPGPGSASWPNTASRSAPSPPGPTETALFRVNSPVGSAVTSPPSRWAGSVGPGELAAAITFLLSEDAGFITGQTPRVDGGASIGGAPR